MEKLLEAGVLCTATSPTQPNYSGHARGRKCHISYDGKTTLCNLLVDKIHEPKKGMHWSTISNGLCLTCEGQLELEYYVEPIREEDIVIDEQTGKGYIK